MRRHRLRIGLGAGAIALALSGLLAPAASATFHEMYVREVYPGRAAQPDSEYVELQMWSPGQNFVNTHTIRVYNATGEQVSSAKFTANVANGANQSTILAATPAAESQFGITADVSLTPAGEMNPAGGAVCWESLDCVAWGNFSGFGLLPSPPGAPAAPGGIPDGMALKRSIARSCATLLEASDDRDNSATDFDVVFPNPRPNSVPPTEKPCTTETGGGGPKGGGAPQTTLKRKPAKKTHDRTPTFRFSSNDDSATFQCKVDGGKFKSCRSPFTTKKLSFGKHTFRVRAKDRSGEIDSSPAAFTFKVLH